MDEPKSRTVGLNEFASDVEARLQNLQNAVTGLVSVVAVLTRNAKEADPHLAEALESALRACAESGQGQWTAQVIAESVFHNSQPQASHSPRLRPSPVRVVIDNGPVE